MKRCYIDNSLSTRNKWAYFLIITKILNDTFYNLLSKTKLNWNSVEYKKKVRKKLSWLKPYKIFLIDYSVYFHCKRTLALCKLLISHSFFLSVLYTKNFSRPDQFSVENMPCAKNSSEKKMIFFEKLLLLIYVLWFWQYFTNY